MRDFATCKEGKGENNESVAAAREQVNISNENCQKKSKVSSV